MDWDCNQLTTGCTCLEQFICLQLVHAKHFDTFITLLLFFFFFSFFFFSFFFFLFFFFFSFFSFFFFFFFFFFLLLLLLCSSENYLYAIQLKGTQGAKAWPVLWLVKLELKGSVQLKSRVKICETG